MDNSIYLVALPAQLISLPAVKTPDGCPPLPHPLKNRTPPTFFASYHILGYRDRRADFPPCRQVIALLVVFRMAIVYHWQPTPAHNKGAITSPPQGLLLGSLCGWLGRQHYRRQNTFPLVHFDNPRGRMRPRHSAWTIVPRCTTVLEAAATTAPLSEKQQVVGVIFSCRYGAAPWIHAFRLKAEAFK